jgi:hypothetical protein
VTDERLTDELALRCLGLRPAPGRYLKSARSWIPRSKFRPLVDIRDAFRVLEALTDDYSLTATPGGVFTVQVQAGGRIEMAAGKPKARAISLAVAHAIGLLPEADASRPAARKQR